MRMDGCDNSSKYGLISRIHDDILKSVKIQFGPKLLGSDSDDDQMISTIKLSEILGNIPEWMRARRGERRLTGTEVECTEVAGDGSSSTLGGLGSRPVISPIMDQRMRDAGWRWRVVICLRRSGAGLHGRSCVIMSPLEITDGLGGIMGVWCQVWDQESGIRWLGPPVWSLGSQSWGLSVWDPASGSWNLG